MAGLHQVVSPCSYSTWTWHLWTWCLWTWDGRDPHHTSPCSSLKDNPSSFSGMVICKIAWCLRQPLSRKRHTNKANFSINSDFNFSHLYMRPTHQDKAGMWDVGAEWLSSLHSPSGPSLSPPSLTFSHQDTLISSFTMQLHNITLEYAYYCLWSVYIPEFDVCKTVYYHLNMLRGRSDTTTHISRTVCWNNSKFSLTLGLFVLFKGTKLQIGRFVAKFFRKGFVGRVAIVPLLV